MELPFTHRPGRRERHLRRRHGNPLFAWPAELVAPETLLAAQQADHEEMEAFRASLASLVQEAAELPPDSGSDQILDLKARLEQHYEQSCGLPEEHDRERAAIAKLIDAIMRTLWRHVGDDTLARQELGDEQAARQIHFRLLEQPLVADLLHPETPIQPQDLTPALLSATDAEIDAACEIFEASQMAVILDEAEALRGRLSDTGLDLTGADRAIDRLRAGLQRHQPGAPH